MYLWDYEMESYKDEIDRLRGLPRLAVVVNAIDWTVRTLDPPIDDTESVDFIQSTLNYCRTALDAGNASPVLTPDIESRITLYSDSKGGETGVPNLLDALTGCFGYGEDRIRTQAVYDALSACYEAALLIEAERLGADIDLDFERLNDRCHQVIDHQKGLIDRA
ncbi:hypothetical protein [Stackebrandtia soli]|uniref:hypothetical protein n=1 Tax=Stackebrandtia soli TaxID=1892856 RepID=UPI0039EA96D3